MGWKSVVFSKTDLDSGVTAVVLRVAPEDNLVWRPEGALVEELADPAVLCIEAGGSGRTMESNFDHHDATGPVSAACRQAFRAALPHQAAGENLVAYAEWIDTRRGPFPPPISSGLTLTALISGVMASTAEGTDRMRAVLGVLYRFLDLGLDPRGPVPDLAEWEAFRNAKRRAQAALLRTAARVNVFHSDRGVRAGCIETSVLGALGLVYSMDCDVAIAYSPDLGPGGTRKCTVGARHGRDISRIAAALSEREPGWGGPAGGSIVGSPRAGTRLSAADVQDLVRIYG